MLIKISFDPHKTELRLFGRWQSQDSSPVFSRTVLWACLFATLCLSWSVSVWADFSYRLRKDRLHLSGPDSGPADLPEAHQLEAQVRMRLDACPACPATLTSARGPVPVIVPLCSVAVLWASLLRSSLSRKWPSCTLSSMCTTWWGPCTSLRMRWCPLPMWLSPWQVLPPKMVSRLGIWKTVSHHRRRHQLSYCFVYWLFLF